MTAFLRERAEDSDVARFTEDDTLCGLPGHGLKAGARYKLWSLDRAAFLGELRA
jgi:hypothetical protein